MSVKLLALAGGLASAAWADADKLMRTGADELPAAQAKVTVANARRVMPRSPPPA